MKTTKSQHGGYSEGQTVHTTTYVSQEHGDWPVEQDGTLLDYVGDGEWAVYVPGHGQVTVHEHDFS